MSRPMNMPLLDFQLSTDNQNGQQLATIFSSRRHRRWDGGSYGFRLRFFYLFFCLWLWRKISWDNNFWYVGYFQVNNGQVKIFLIWIHYARSQRRKWWCYGVGPSVNNSFPEHISESTCPIVYKFYTQHPYRGSSCAFWGIWALTYFWFRTMTYLDVLTHTSFPEQISKSTGPMTVILHIYVL